MEKKTVGAWVIHHTHKLQTVASPSGFDRIALAGKAGILLSVLTASDQETTVAAETVEALAEANGISPTLELPTLLNTLTDSHLIDISGSGEVVTLGLTTASVLSHVSDIYANSDPRTVEDAAIAISEETSLAPAQDHRIAEYAGDVYGLSGAEVETLLRRTEQIGFVDYEALGQDRKLYFNGNLFRREDAAKTDAILSSLGSDDILKVVELQELLARTACVPYTQAVALVGKSLFDKLQAIGLFDVNSLSNERETTHFITRPSAFQKYGNSLVEDALDLAKAFATSLTYGVVLSSPGRGRITMLPLLMSKLIRGEWVGPATAIGQDYRILELKHVIQVRPDEKGMYFMRLLKKDIGELALQAMEQADISELSLPSLHSASISTYAGPETNREIVRRQQIEKSRREVVDILRTIRQD